MKPEKCPVCYGRGTVPATFYAKSEERAWAVDTSETECRTCHGKGYILCPEG